MYAWLGVSVSLMGGFLWVVDDEWENHTRLSDVLTLFHGWMNERMDEWVVVDDEVDGIAMYLGRVRASGMV